MRSVLGGLLLVMVGCMGCGDEDAPSSDSGVNYPVDADGKRIPIANLSVVTSSGDTIFATIDGVAVEGVDTARFAGLVYSEAIAKLNYVLPDGAVISPVPPAVTDSVEIAVPHTGSTKMKRVYWDKVSGPYTITTQEGETYALAFKLEDYAGAKQYPVDTDDEPAEQEAGTVFIDRFNNLEDSIPDVDTWKLAVTNGAAWNRFMQNTEGYECAVVKDGMLHLIAKKEGGLYKTGGIRTQFGFDINTRFEVRAVLSHAFEGGWPALWQMPFGDNVPVWPAGGEIDLVEWWNSAPDIIFQTLHAGPEQVDISFNIAQPVCDITEWHVYAVERTSEGITTFIDNERMGFVSRETVVAGSQIGYPFDEYPFDIILNMSLATGTVIDDESLPVEFLVDWVRILKISESAE